MPSYLDPAEYGLDVSDAPPSAPAPPPAPDYSAAASKFGLSISDTPPKQPAAPVDYAASASKFGLTISSALPKQAAARPVDYGASAAKFGLTVSDSAPTSAPEPARTPRSLGEQMGDILPSLPPAGAQIVPPGTAAATHFPKGTVAAPPLSQPSLNLPGGPNIRQAQFQAEGAAIGGPVIHEATHAPDFSQLPEVQAIKQFLTTSPIPKIPIADSDRDTPITVPGLGTAPLSVLKTIANTITGQVTPETAAVVLASGGIGKLLAAGANSVKIAAALRAFPTLAKAVDIAARTAVPGGFAVYQGVQAGKAGVTAYDLKQQATQLRQQGNTKDADVLDRQAEEAVVSGGTNLVLAALSAVGAVAQGKATAGLYPPEASATARPVDVFGKTVTPGEVGSLASPATPAQAGATAQVLEAGGARLAAQQWAALDSTKPTNITVNGRPATVSVERRVPGNISGKPAFYQEVLDANGNRLVGGTPDIVHNWLQANQAEVNVGPSGPFGGKMSAQGTEPPPVTANIVQQAGRVTFKGADPAVLGRVNELLDLHDQAVAAGDTVKAQMYAQELSDVASSNQAPDLSPGQLFQGHYGVIQLMRRTPGGVDFTRVDPAGVPHVESAPLAAFLRIVGHPDTPQPFDPSKAKKGDVIPSTRGDLVFSSFRGGKVYFKSDGQPVKGVPLADFQAIVKPQVVPEKSPTPTAATADTAAVPPLQPTPEAGAAAAQEGQPNAPLLTGEPSPSLTTPAASTETATVAPTGTGEVRSPIQVGGLYSSKAGTYKVIETDPQWTRYEFTDQGGQVHSATMTTSAFQKLKPVKTGETPAPSEQTPAPVPPAQPTPAETAGTAPAQESPVPSTETQVPPIASTTETGEPRSTIAETGESGSADAGIGPAGGAFLQLVPGQKVPVKTADQASAIVRRVIDGNGWGASDLPAGFGEIHDSQGKLIARVSYNGRLWAPDGQLLQNAFDSTTPVEAGPEGELQAAKAGQPPAGAEPWQMTRHQYLVRGNRMPSVMEAEHRQAVQSAIAAGKAVPPEVLAEYPDLKAAAKKPEGYDFASTQANLSGPVADGVRAAGVAIPKDQLAEKGTEKEPHITALYGLHDEDPTAVHKLLANEPPITATLGKASIFHTDDADVLKVDVDSPDLHRINKSLASLPHTNTHGEYKPHVTIAYLQKGQGAQYEGKDVPGVTGQTVVLNSIAFSDRSGKQTEIPLKGTAPAEPASGAAAQETPWWRQPDARSHFYDHYLDLWQKGLLQRTEAPPGEEFGWKQFPTWDALITRYEAHNAKPGHEPQTLKDFLANLGMQTGSGVGYGVNLPANEQVPTTEKPPASPAPGAHGGAPDAASTQNASGEVQPGGIAPSVETGSTKLQREFEATKVVAGWSPQIKKDYGFKLIEWWKGDKQGNEPKAPKQIAPATAKAAKEQLLKILEPVVTPAPVVKSDDWPKLTHVTTPEAATAIRENGFIPSKDGEMGPGIYLVDNAAKLTADKFAGKEQIPVTVMGKLLTFQDGPNRVLQVMRALYGRDGAAKYDALTFDQKQWKHMQSLARVQGYVGFQVEGKDAEPKNTVVFDAAFAHVEPPVKSDETAGGIAEGGETKELPPYPNEAWKWTKDEYFRRATVGSKPERTRHDKGWIVEDSRYDAPAGLRWWDTMPKGIVSARPAILGEFYDRIHRFYTEQAVKEGKPVPAEVLAEYPDLKATSKPTLNATVTAHLDKMIQEVEAGDRALKHTPENAYIHAEKLAQMIATAREYAEKIPTLSPAEKKAVESTIAAAEAFIKQAPKKPRQFQVGERVSVNLHTGTGRDGHATVIGPGMRANEYLVRVDGEDFDRTVLAKDLHVNPPEKPGVTAFKPGDKVTAYPGGRDGDTKPVPGYIVHQDSDGNYLVRHEGVPAQEQLAGQVASPYLPQRTYTAADLEPRAQEHSFKVETEDHGKWISNAQRWISADEAQTAGSELYGRWMGMGNWRVVPSVEPANYRWDKEKYRGVPMTPEEAQQAIQQAAQARQKAEEEAARPPAIRLANHVFEQLKAGKSLGNQPEFYQTAEKFFGSPRTSGNWDVKDAMDAMEAGVNMWIIENGERLLKMDPIQGLAEIRKLMALLPTQGIRTDEQLKAQQFSTPPSESYVAALAAALRSDDVVLEPSAGNGGLAAYPKSIGATVHVNEISDRRAQMLEAAGFGKPTAHDGELINALLDTKIQPTVVLMNPPFSSGALKSHLGRNRNQYGFNHVDQALQRLAPGGRLVAILGGGRADDLNGGASFTGGATGKWFDRVRKQYNIRANVRINGKEYQKYGTNFATRIIVIDKTGPTPDWQSVLQGKGAVLQGNADTLEQAYNLLRKVAHDRPQVQPGNGSQAGAGQGKPGTGLGTSPRPGGVRGGGTGTGRPGVTGPGEPGNRPVPPAGSPGPSQPGTGNQSPDLQQPGPGVEGRPGATGAPDLQSGAESDDLRPVHGDGQPEESGEGLGALGGISAEDLIRQATEQLAQELGQKPTAPATAKAPTPKPPAPPKTSTRAPAPAPTKTSAPAPPAKSAIDQAADDALAELRAMMAEDEGPAAIQAAQGPAIPPKVLIGLAKAGARHIIQGATSFDTWSQKLTAEAGDVLKWASNKTGVPQDQLLRLVHQTAQAVAVNFRPLNGDETKDGGLTLLRAEMTEAEKADTDAYVSYQPTIQGGKHPGDIVETKTMATVPLPGITYKPHLPPSIMDKGLSAVQMEAVAIAGQQNEILLPGGIRAAALIGDGTGVGKGRIAAAYLWDNFRQGRKRLVFVTEKWDLAQDIMRDLNGIGAADLLRGVEQDSKGKYQVTPKSVIQMFNKWKYGVKVSHEGMIFTTYGTVRAKDKKGNRRVAQLEEYLKGDDNGEGAVIVFDECHALKNAIPLRGAQASQIGSAVKTMLGNVPKLRTLSLSATAATDVINLGYLDRLGLWGPGTPFPNGFSEFQQQIASGGLSAMEMIARELKAQGKYVSRTLSFHGVEYDTKEHALTDEQKALYRTAAKAWGTVLDSAVSTIVNTTNGGGQQRGNFLSQFYGAQQRFFNILITTLKIPTCVEVANEALANGKSVVISLVNTNEAAQNREKNKATDEDDDDEIPDYDFGPAEMLVELIKNHYPTQQYADDVNDNGDPIKVPVYTTDDQGREIPVLNPAAVAARDALIDQIKNELHMPDNPLDILIQSLGGQTKVAELTGRKERYDRNLGKFVSRGDPGTPQKDINLVEMRNFQGGKKRVAILSGAAGTGISLHAGNDVANQQQRVHITLQVGWSADKAMQMFGRTHRTNQKQPPQYVMLVSDLGGEKRFVSTISRRLGSLGALTKGQKNATGGTDLMDKVNFETDQGRAATNTFYERMLANGPVPGAYQMVMDDEAPEKEQGKAIPAGARVKWTDPDGEWLYGKTAEPVSADMWSRANVTTDDGTASTVHRSGLRLLADHPVERQQQMTGMQVLYDLHVLKPGRMGAGMTVPPAERTNVTRLLNRLLALDPDVQNAVYNYFYDIFQATVQAAIDRGQLDTGVKTLPGDEFHVKEQRVISKDPKTGAETFYYPVDVATKTKRVSPEDLNKRLAQHGDENPTFLVNDKGKVALVWDAPPMVHETGRIEPAFYRIRPDNGKPQKITRGQIGGRTEEVTEKAKDAVETATGDLERAQRSVATYKSYAERSPNETWWRQGAADAQNKLDAAQTALAEAQELAKDPTAWAKARWAEQHADAPSHTTNEHHFIGGAVLRFWNPIKDITHRPDIYTAVDSTTGKRIVGIEVPKESIGQLLQRITGGASTVNAAQLITDVLRNNLSYTLEGGIQVRPGRVGRDPVIQLIPPNPGVGQTLRNMGVLYEKGIQPIYYLPNTEEGPQQNRRGAVARRVVEQYPVQADQGPAALQSRPVPGFYSQLQRTLEQKMPARASVQQVLSIIQNPQNGVKTDELQWSGLKEFLEGKGSVSKEEVLAFVKANEVQVEEVTHGKDPQTEAELEQAQLAFDQARSQQMQTAVDVETAIRDAGLANVVNGANGQGTYRKYQRPDLYGEVARYAYGTIQGYPAWANHDQFAQVKAAVPQELFDRYEADTRAKMAAQKVLNDARQNVESGKGTKYQNYTIPGGENYRELLLTLPEKGKGWQVFSHDGGPVASFDTQAEAAADAKRRGPQFDYARKGEGWNGQGSAAPYTSPHWDEKNVLAHIRFNDRTGPNGEKILHIEEIQSDWHQAGKKHGYRDEMSILSPEAFVDKYLRLEEYPEDLLIQSPHHFVYTANNDAERTFNWDEGEPLAAPAPTAQEARQNAIREIRDRSERKGIGVPRAPFAKSWPELAFKRVLRYAAENGYDQLTWTTGEQQAERYDLSKQIDSLKVLEGSYEETGGPGYQVTARKGGQQVIEKRVKAAELPELIGKEMADKAITTIEENKKRPVPKYAATFAGLDLKVGGEGMKGFYDKILPDYANRYAKKWGAKVGTTEITTASGDVTVAARGDQFVVSRRGREIGTFPDMRQARAFMDSADQQVGTETVHSLPITPAMKESVMAGQPLFAKPGGEQPEGAMPTPEQLGITRLKDTDAAENTEEYWRAATSQFTKIDGAPALLVNNAGLDIVAQNMGLTGRGLTHVHTHALALGPSEQQSILDRAQQVQGTNAYERALQTIADQIQANNPTQEPMGAIQTGESIPDWELAKDALEEADHHKQMQLTGGELTGMPVEMLDSPEGTEAQQTLAQSQGYRLPRPESPYYDQQRQVMAAEVGVRLMRPGRWKELTSDPQKARDLATQYIEGLDALHGEHADAILDQVYRSVPGLEALERKRSRALEAQYPGGTEGIPQGRPRGPTEVPGPPLPGNEGEPTEGRGVENGPATNPLLPPRQLDFGVPAGRGTSDLGAPGATRGTGEGVPSSPEGRRPDTGGVGQRGAVAPTGGRGELSNASGRPSAPTGIQPGAENGGQVTSEPAQRGPQLAATVAPAAEQAQSPSNEQNPSQPLTASPLEARGPKYDWTKLLDQVRTSSDEDLLSSYPLFQAALKSGERRKLIDPGAVELADQLITEKSEPSTIREMLSNEFQEAEKRAAAIRPVPRTQASNPPVQPSPANTAGAGPAQATPVATPPAPPAGNGGSAAASPNATATAAGPGFFQRQTAAIQKRYGFDLPDATYSGLGAFKDVFVREASQLEKKAPEAYLDLRKLAGSRAQSSVILNTVAPQIKAALEGSGINWEQFRAAIMESRLQGIAQRWHEMADGVESFANVEDVIDAYHNGLRDLLEAMEGKRGLDDFLKQDADAMLANDDIESLREFLSENFDKAGDSVANLEPVLQPAGGFSQITQNPQFQKALGIYKQAVEKPIAENHASNEGIFSDALGPLDTYIPLIPLSAADQARAGFNFGRKVPYKKPKNAANAFATGLGEYSLAMDAFAQRISSAIRSNNKAAFVQALIDHGLVVELKKGQQPPTTDLRGREIPVINIDGREFPASVMNVTQDRTIFQDGKAVHLPGKRILVPDWMRTELLPSLEASDISKIPNLAQRWIGALNAFSLQGPLDFVFHSTNVLGVLMFKTPYAGTGIFSKTIGNTPVTKIFTAILNTIHQYQAFDPEHFPATTEKLYHMAKLGLIPGRYGKETYNRKIAEETGAELRRSTMGPVLFGPRGLDIKARLLMYDIAHEINPNVTDTELVQFIRSMGDYNRELEGRIERFVKEMGVGPFATAGTTMLRNGISSWLGGGPMPKAAPWTGKLEPLNGVFPRGAAMRLGAMMGAGALGLLALWILGEKALTGKFPWQNRNSRFLMTPVPPTFRNSPVGRAIWGNKPRDGYINWAFFSPLPSRGGRALGIAGGYNTAIAGGTFGQILEGAEKDIMNSSLHPLASGPAFKAGFVLATGMDPYISGLRDRQTGERTVKFMPAIAKLPAGVPTIAARLGEAMLNVNSFYQNGAAAFGLGEKSARQEDQGDRWLRSITDVVAPRLLGQTYDVEATRRALATERKASARPTGTHGAGSFGTFGPNSYNSGFGKF